jgi:hypothetical protein
MALFDDAALTKGVSKGGTSPPAGPCLFANSVNWQLGIPLWRPLWRPTPFLPRRRNGVGILFKFPFVRKPRSGTAYPAKVTAREKTLRMTGHPQSFLFYVRA